LAFPGEPKPTVSLYPPDGVVNVATGNTLRTSLKDPMDGGSNWYFVELYEHMCPHCWYAVPIVTDVAHAFKGNPTWKTAAVNCHMQTNREVCLFLEMISGAANYPTFLLCPPKDQGESTWGTDKLLKTLPEAAQSLFTHLAGETRSTFMDLLRCRTRFKPRRDSKPGGDLLSAAEIADWVVQQTGLSCAHPGSLTMGADFVDKMIQNPFSPPGPPGWLHDDKEGEPGVLAFSPEHRWWDALLGFVSALNMRYRPHRHNLIVSCVQFLARTFPVKGRALLDLVKRLEKGPMHNSRDVTKMLKDWSKHSRLIGWEEEGNIQTCSGSSSVSNCAMWTLLHVTLTAVATRGITGKDLNNDQAMAQQPGADGMMLSIKSATDFVKAYIGVFQTCDHCTAHFNQEFKECAYDRCKIAEYRSLPLWLWRTHNAISLRASMRFNLTVDRRWPMYEDCPRCWKQHVVMGMESKPEKRAIHRWKWNMQRLSSFELDAVFNLDHVFWHMVRAFLGLERVPPLEASELTKKEMTDMSAATQDERYEAERKEYRKEHSEATKATGSMKLGHNPEEMETRRGSHVQVVAAIAGIIAVGAAVVLLVCNYQQLLGGPERASRSPLIRAPQEDMEADDNDLPSQLPEREFPSGDSGGVHHDVDADEATE